MGLFEDLKAAISSGDTGALRGQLEQLVGDLDLEALKQKFEDAGLGEKIQSWIGTGENEPATADDVKSALDPAELQALADRAGTDVDEAAKQAADALPQIVDRLTPEGRLPVHS